jgi:outer membrane lipoprotein SlyB
MTTTLRGRHHRCIPTEYAMVSSPIRNIMLFATLAAVIGVSGCVMPAAHGNAYSDDYRSQRSANRGCQNCGTVTDIIRYQGEGNASGGGAVIGAVVGGLLGNQVGGGSGRKAATVAGAVAGGVAGHRIEQRSGSASGYEVQVRLDSGRMVVLEQRDIGDMRIGSYVRVSDGYAVLR